MVGICLSKYTMMRFKTSKSDDVWVMISISSDWIAEIKNTRTKEYKEIDIRDFDKWLSSGGITKL